MSEIERNKAAARALLVAIARGDAKAIADSYAEDGTLFISGHTLVSGTYTRAQVAATAGSVLEVFPEGVHHTVKAITAEDDRVAVETECTGKHVSGALYTNQFHFLMRFRDGKLVDLKEYMDTERVTDVICGGQRPPASA